MLYEAKNAMRLCAASLLTLTLGLGSTACSDDEPKKPAPSADMTMPSPDMGDPTPDMPTTPPVEAATYSPGTAQTLAVDATLDYTISGLRDGQAYRLTLVVAEHITGRGAEAVFEDANMDGVADAGDSQLRAVITQVHGEALASPGRTAPGAMDGPSDPKGVFPVNGAITFTVRGVGAGAVLPVLYHNAGASTFLELDQARRPTEVYFIGPSITVPMTERSLYEQLGGEAGIRAVLAKFLENVVADARINWMFANADAVALSNLLHDQVCQATGGGCVYGGKNMKEAHVGMAITDAQFDALIEDFLAALDELKVPYADAQGALDMNATIYPLLAALVGMKGDIVEDAAADKVYFNRLGGYGAVSAVIDGLLTNVGADDRINQQFANTDLVNLRRLLIEQVCEATGGYCVYTGRTMKESHQGLGITRSAFFALVEDLLMALDTLGVPYTPNTYDGGALADALIQTLAGMADDIIEDPNN